MGLCHECVCVCVLVFPAVVYTKARPNVAYHTVYVSHQYLGSREAAQIPVV
jgi:hypothetical protein